MGRHTAPVLREKKLVFEQIPSPTDFLGQLLKLSNGF
jgi:hypothetical protein